MALEIVVETRGVRIAQRAHVPVHACVLLACKPRDLECMVESIFVEGPLAIQLRRAAQCEYEVLLDAPEVIFRLSVSEAECGARVCASEDVRYAVSIAINGDRAGESWEGSVGTL